MSVNQKAANRFRLLSRLIGYGGVIACILTAAIWYVTSIVINKQTFYIADIIVIPIVAVACILVAVILRILAAYYGKAAKAEAEAEAAAAAAAEEETPEEPEADEEPADAVYEEEALSPVEVEAGADVIAEDAAEETVTAAAEAEPEEEAAPTCAVCEKVSEAVKKVKEVVSEQVAKVVPPEKMEAIKEKTGKAAEAVKKSAKVVVPVAVACVAVGLTVQRVAARRRIERDRAITRRHFYRWLG